MKQTSTIETPFDDRDRYKPRSQRVLRRPHQALSFSGWGLESGVLTLSPSIEISVTPGPFHAVRMASADWADHGVKNALICNKLGCLPAIHGSALGLLPLDPPIDAIEEFLAYNPIEEFVSAPFVVETPVGARGSFDRAQRELARLQDGWAGPGTLAPLPGVLEDLSLILPVLPGRIDAPEFEVDGSDGALAMVWHLQDKSFSLILTGNKKVVGVLSPSAGYKAWTLPIAKEIEIAEKLEDQRLSILLGL